MSFQITTAFVQQFRSNLEMLAQQMQSRLMGAVTVETLTGKSLWWDQVGTVRASRITTRHGDTVPVDVPHARRRIDLASYNVAAFIDNADKVRMLAEPSSAYAQTLNASMNREKDFVITEAAFASANTGEDGTTAVAFPAAQQIAVNAWNYGAGSGNAGLTVSKLLEAGMKLTVANVPLEDRFLVVPGKQVADLLATTEATSVDYNIRPTLVDGRIDYFAGFKFIEVDPLLLPTDGSGYRRVLAYHKAGIVLAQGQDIIARVAERADKNHTMQAYYEMSIGAARVEEARVVEIKCLES